MFQLPSVKHSKVHYWPGLTFDTGRSTEWYVQHVGILGVTHDGDSRVSCSARAHSWQRGFPRQTPMSYC